MKPSKALITSEGYPAIAYSVGLFLFLSVATLLLSSVILAVPALIALLLVIFVVAFFRNPERIPPADEQLLIAPADGTIVYVGPAEQEHLGACQKISIFMSVFNVHVNWAPCTAKVIERFYRPGRFLDVRNSRASSENEQLGLVLETGQGMRMVCVQIAGLIARRIHCYVDAGDLLKRGERYGMIRFGSRLDLYLPTDVTPLVAVGEVTAAGETPLARLPQETDKER